MKKLFAGLLAASLFISPALADSTIDALSAAAALAGTESVPIFQTANPAVKATTKAIGNTADSFLTKANNFSDLSNLETARLNAQIGYGSPSNRFYAVTDCVVAPVGSDNWIAVVSGAGAGASSIADASFNALGILSLDLGTTTTGRSAIVSFLTSAASAQIKLGSGRARFQSKAAIHILSNGTDTYTTRVGFIDALSTESVDGVFFRYTDSVNAGKWQAVTRSNNVETATDTGITPVADTFHTMSIDVNAAGTSVVFAIDGSTVATTATNIPTGAGRETGYGAGSVKSLGTTATSGGYLDWMEVDYIFTAPR